MNLFDRIIYQKDKGDSSNYDKVFSDLHSMMHSPIDKFIFDNNEISWIYFRPVDFYNDIILDNDETVFFYLRNQDLTFESIFCSYFFDSDITKTLADRHVVINLIYVFGKLFPGLNDFEKRPIRIHSNNSCPDTPIKKMNYYFRTTLEKFERRAKPIFEMTDYYKDYTGRQRIVEKLSKSVRSEKIKKMKE